MANSEKRKAVILLSGGLDSSTTLAIARAEGYQLYAVSFNYHQRHAIELESAKKVAYALDVKRHMTVSFDLTEIGGSALTSSIEIPKNSIQKRKNKEEKPGDKTSGEQKFQEAGEIPVTYVPARNTIFLSFALAWAEVLDAENIFIGANAIDYSGYPDCRPEYIRAFENMANLATKRSVEGELRFKIIAPLISMKKSEIIKKGIELGLDYSLTWSCYDPQPIKDVKLINTPGHQNLQSDFVPCGACDSCILRENGFREVGIPDPLINK